MKGRISPFVRALEHIEGDILLTMPNIPELDDPNVTDQMLEENMEVIEQLENVIMSWGVHIEKVKFFFKQIDLLMGMKNKRNK